MDFLTLPFSVCCFSLPPSLTFLWSVLFLLQHVAAVLARKKVEEEQKAKKLQQIEEDRKMAEELLHQRMEKEVRKWRGKEGL